MSRPTYNPALQSSFRLEIPGLDHVNYFVQRAELPSLNVGAIPAPYRNHQLNLPDNRVQYDPLNIDFLVSEGYENHSELRLWMHKTTHSHDTMPVDLRDITLHLTTSTNNPGKSVIFYSAFPQMIGGIPLDGGSTDETPIVCTCSFSYAYYDVVETKA